MSKNKLRTPVRLAALATAAAFGVALFTSDRTALVYGSQAGSYPTEVLSYEDFIITASVDLDTEYPTYVDVTYDSRYSSTTFVAYLVDGGDYVTEGDPVIEITASIDEIDLLEARMDLERAQSDYDAYVTEAASALALAQNAVNEASDATEKKIAELKLEKLTMQQAKALASYESRVQSLEDRITAYETEAVTTTINAPATGRIYFPTRGEWRLHDGDTITSSTYLGTVYEQDTSIFTIESTGHLFRYGMEMSLSDRDGNVYPAHVVNCTSSSLSSTLLSDYAYIVPDVEIPATYYVDLVATYESVHLEHVITIPTGSYHTDTNGTYVYVVTDSGAMMKQYFTRGRMMNNCCLALDGLTEGMTIVMN